MADPDTRVAPVKSIAEVRADMAKLTTSYDPEHILRKMGERVGESRDELEKSGDDKDMVRLATLSEFDNGILMTQAVSEISGTLAIELMRNLKKEFDCQTMSEKATAELAAINYIRTLDIQRKINNYLSTGQISDMGVRYLAVMSKELDRANRHYLTAIQTLRVLKQPPMQLNIRASTAVVGQNQIVQANNDPK